MANQPLKSHRARGVVWVCDIENSTRLLNDERTADVIERYIPRLHWVSRKAVDAAQGEYVKWTGDGFLAWLPVHLHRELGRRAIAVFEMIWHLTVFSNVTGLGLGTPHKFRLRHRVTIEHDALVTQVRDGDDEYRDLLGRAVVLAFRLSGAPASFPGVVTQKEVLDAAKSHQKIPFGFKRWKLKEEERLKYFKGERWGTGSVYVSAETAPRARKLETVIASAKKAIERAPNPAQEVTDSQARAQKFLGMLLEGPEWSRDASTDYVRFVREGMLGSVESIVRKLERAATERGEGGASRAGSE